jgi:hypothetical protein
MHVMLVLRLCDTAINSRGVVEIKSFAGRAADAADLLMKTGNLVPAFNQISPGLGDQLISDLRDSALRDAWGLSRANDCPESFLRACNTFCPNEFLPDSAHAGIVHTYGYLISGHHSKGVAKHQRWTSGLLPWLLNESLEGLLDSSSTMLSLVTQRLSALSNSSRLTWSSISAQSELGTTSKVEIFTPPDGRPPTFCSSIGLAGAPRV